MPLADYPTGHDLSTCLAHTKKYLYRNRHLAKNVNFTPISVNSSKMRPLRRFGLGREQAFPAGPRAFGGMGREKPEPSAELLDVLPQATDQTLTGWTDPHIVAAPLRPSPTPHLWIFFGGSYGKPQRQLTLIDHIASLGHWAINLRYPNDWTIGGLSRRSTVSHTHEALRLQILDGRDRSGLLPLPPQDCILNRLQKLLLWLSARQVGKGWDAFLDGGAPRWDRIAAAGHSQGGGHAAILGKHLSLERVVMLSAPADCVEEGASAPWLARDGATAADRYRGFAHLRDPAIARILGGWESLGLSRFGAPVRVESSEPPYENSHQFVTDREVEDDRHHGSVAVDRFIPYLRDGSPAFRPVWSQLFQLS